jgi:hypothetical protein
MTTRDKRTDDAPDKLTPGQILVAFAKLFGGGRGVKKFARSGLRYVELPDAAVLIEQNPKKTSEWAKLAQQGHRVAWVMRDGAYLARVVDDEVTMLKE